MGGLKGRERVTENNREGEDGLPRGVESGSMRRKKIRHEKNVRRVRVGREPVGREDPSSGFIHLQNRGEL